MKSGIYKITCGKRFYIGSSKDTAVRWQNHQSALRRGDHANNFMQNLWNKTRGHGFKFEVLMACAPEMMLDREQELIDHYWGDKNFMNLNPKADRPRGWKGRKRGAWMQSEAYRNKMSEATKGKKKTEATKTKISQTRKEKGLVPTPEALAKAHEKSRKAVYVVMNNNERLAFASVSEARKTIGVGATTINEWLKGRSMGFTRKGIKEIGYA